MRGGLVKKMVKGTALLVMMLVGLMVDGSLMMRPVMAEGEGFNEICKDSEIDNELKKRAGCFEQRKIPEVGVKIINFFIGLIVLSGVLAIVFAGQRMVTGGDDAGKVKQARIMIAYGVVGIVVAMVAFAIVNFVLKGLTK